jgi:pyridoxamine 5'-phosphate oxidase
MISSEEIAQLRKDYSLESLDIDKVENEPFRQFQKWLNEAVEAHVPEPTAMNVATVSKEGKPSSRIILLKGVDDHSFKFYSNYQSRKGHEIDETPFVALNFFWAELERQVRVEGSIEKLGEAESLEYFHSRPRESQIGAWVSPQSQHIESRGLLAQKYMELSQKFENQDIPKPSHWGGYKVIGKVALVACTIELFMKNTKTIGLFLE